MKGTKKRILALLLAVALSVSTASLLTFSAAAARVGQVVNKVLHTDIVCYINGYPIKSYNIDGYTCVVAEELRDYGMSVKWSAGERTLTITRDLMAAFTAGYTPSKTARPVGSYAMDVLYTDIVTYVNDTKVESYNIDGYTCIDTEFLRPLCSDYKYSNSSRTLNLTLSDEGYVKKTRVSSMKPIESEGWSWHDKSTDTFGNSYSNVFYTYWAGSGYAYYYIAGEYTRISATLATGSGMYNSGSATFKIYADDKLIYSSPEFARKTFPLEISVNLPYGTEFVKFAGSGRSDYLIIADLTFWSE